MFGAPGAAELGHQGVDRIAHGLQHRLRLGQGLPVRPLDHDDQVNVAVTEMTHHRDAYRLADRAHRSAGPLDELGRAHQRHRHIEDQAHA